MTRRLALGWLLMVVGAIAAITPSIAATAATVSSRQTTSLNAGWRFVRGDPAGAADSTFADEDWGKVTLPHSFNAGDGEQRDYYRGPGWYRRAFEIAQVRRDRRLFVQFDGAATTADVYLNGRHIGRHEGGHAAFRFDLSDALKPGRNVLAVRVDNAAGDVVTPLGGDFTIFGGLYRGVSLIEVDPVHIDLMDYGGPGVYAHVAALDPSAARIALKVRVTNDGATARAVPVEGRVIDAAGHEVARVRSEIRLGAHRTGASTGVASIASPHMWDGVRDPYLYRVEVQLAGQGDAVSVPLGVRRMEVDPAKGFLLNGRRYPLRGVNLMHSARPGKGTAVTAAEVAEDFDILEEMGSTGVRLVHFQHPQAAYDEADRRGLVVWTEIGVNSKIADTPAFRANAVQQMRELIAQNYNHPSVAMWGIGNEVYAEDVGVTRVLTDINAAAKAADPSRPTVYAHCCQADSAPKALVSDVIGFNRYFGWYPDQDGNTLGQWAAGFHAAHPERAFAVSEYGAGASILHQEDPPRRVVPTSGWHPEQYQALYHEQNWREIADKPYIFGSFVWVGFDLASGGRNEGDRPGINDKGLVTYDRKVRKDAWYWYKANWSDEPVLYITSRRFDVRHERAVEVKVYTNGGAATLMVNGKPLARQSPADHVLRWQVKLDDGPNRIVVRDERDGRPLSDEVIWTYQPHLTMLATPAAETGVALKP